MPVHDNITCKNPADCAPAGNMRAVGPALVGWIPDQREGIAIARSGSPAEVAVEFAWAELRCTQAQADLVFAEVSAGAMPACTDFNTVIGEHAEV